MFEVELRKWRRDICRNLLSHITWGVCCSVKLLNRIITKFRKKIKRRICELLDMGELTIGDGDSKGYVYDSVVCTTYVTRYGSKMTLHVIVKEH